MSPEIELGAARPENIRHRLQGQNLRAGARFPPSIVLPTVEIEEGEPGLRAFGMDVGGRDELTLGVGLPSDLLECPAEREKELQALRVFFPAELELFDRSLRPSVLELAVSEME